MFHFQEVELEGKLQDLATKMAPLYQQMAPDAYSNQVCQSDGCSNVTLIHPIFHAVTFSI